MESYGYLCFPFPTRWFRRRRFRCDRGSWGDVSVAKRRKRGKRMEVEDDVMLRIKNVKGDDEGIVRMR
jgi:hypothetical protein